MRWLLIILFFYGWGASSNAGVLIPDSSDAAVSAPVGASSIENLMIIAPTTAYLFYASALKSKLISPDEFEPIASIFDVIQQTKIFVNGQGPCLDNYNSKVDGSNYSAISNSICISSKNLGEKLNFNNAWAQMMALAIREYAHYAGVDPDQADKIQQLALNHLNINAEYRNPFEFVSEFSNGWLDFLKVINTALSTQNELTKQQVLAFATGNQDYADLYFRFLESAGYKAHLFAVETPSQEKAMALVLLKWEIVRLGIYSSIADVTAIRENYEAAFVGKEQVSVEEFIAKYADKFVVPEFSEPTNSVVSKISEPKDYAAALANLKTEYTLVHHAIFDVYAKLLNPEMIVISSQPVATAAPSSSL